MHSASRTRSILLDGRGLTDLRKVSWQSVVFECAKLGGVFMPHDVSCMCFSFWSSVFQHDISSAWKIKFCDFLVFVLMFCAWNI